MINTLKNKCTMDNIKKILIIFLLLQPLLDTYILFEEETINIFKMSPSTIIRIIFVAIMAIMSVFAIKSKKQWVGYITYISLLVIYSIFHLYNATQFSFILQTILIIQYFLKFFI